jgi:hypothetical protein
LCFVKIISGFPVLTWPAKAVKKSVITLATITATVMTYLPDPKNVRPDPLKDHIMPNLGGYLQLVLYPGLAYTEEKTIVKRGVG